ncbi:hypothetical protein LX36DRAFT_270761 [Colletotrichum falcatum]|nr:hypothetical protein LX36DRAFT_270761 [Colletotrichum falcatum]
MTLLPLACLSPLLRRHSRCCPFLTILLLLLLLLLLLAPPLSSSHLPCTTNTTTTHRPGSLVPGDPPSGNKHGTEGQINFIFPHLILLPHRYPLSGPTFRPSLRHGDIRVPSCFHPPPNVCDSRLFLASSPYSPSSSSHLFLPLSFLLTRGEQRNKAKRNKKKKN